MHTVRKPVVAGMFYPKDPRELTIIIHSLLTHAQADLPLPKAIISPHAGYIYSGPIAANAFACLAKASSFIRRVILLGPSHRYPLYGVAAPEVESFATPLGQIKIDHAAIAKILPLAQVEINEAAHAQEHSLEVQLPFLQTLLQDFSLVPLVVGQTTATGVAMVLEKLWDGPETLIVISSDLSHYHDYLTAQQLDQHTAQAIVNLDPAALAMEQACGHAPILGLLQVAKAKQLLVHQIDLRNSGDTVGPKDQVVGYGAFHFLEQHP